MTDSDPSKAFVDEMIRMAWFLTGSEAASHQVLHNVTCEAVGETLSISQRARLLVLRAYYRVFREANSDDVSASETPNNPIWVLPPVERAVYVLRLVMGQAEKDAALQLGLSQKAISGILTRAADRIGKAFAEQSQYA